MLVDFDVRGQQEMDYGLVFCPEAIKHLKLKYL